ncbi:MAG: DNA mismatch repair protein MutS, partial [Deltaproteobacteria bacterium CG07_land_8_20_14_0_80_38_7]
MDDSSLTPMIKQYLAIKEKYSDSILFYRIGDFYEMFFEDAVQASKLLDITLTSRNKNDPNPIPLCGVPHHSVEPYIAKLLQKGKKVAVCDQVEDPKIAKGVVRREVTRVITPGIILDSASVKGDEHNYIAAIAPNDSTEGAFGLAIADVSTGHFSALQFNSMDALSEEVFRLEPKEIILPISLSEKTTFNNKIKKSNFNPVFTVLNNNFFEPQAISGLDGARTLIKQYPMAAKAAAA